MKASVALRALFDVRQRDWVNPIVDGFAASLYKVLDRLLVVAGLLALTLGHNQRAFNDAIAIVNIPTFLLTMPIMIIYLRKLAIQIYISWIWRDDAEF